MATHPDDHNPPQHDDAQHPAGTPHEGEAGHQPDPSKQTKLAGQPGKPTMLAHGEDAAPGAEPGAAPGGVPNMSIDEPAAEVPMLEPVSDVTEMIAPTPPPADEDIPVLEAVPDNEASEKTVQDVVEAVPASDVVEAQPASDVVEAEAVFEDLEAEPVSDIAEAQPVSDARRTDVTGADVPGADVTGSEHVLGEDLIEVEPIESVAGSDVLAGDPISGDAVLGDEPLDRGSRPSARAESPIRAEPDDDDAVDLGGAGGKPAGKKRAARDDLDVTEEVLASEPKGTGSSAVNWNEVGEDSGAVAKPVEDETVAFDTDEGSADSLLGAPGQRAQVPEDASAVNLGELPAKSKSPSGIDPVAEALESGVNLDDAAPLSPPRGAPSVEFDDILTDSADSMPPAKAVKPSAGEESEVTEPTDDDLEAVGKGKKKKKKNGAPVEDEDAAAAALFAEDEAEAVAVPGEDEAEAVAVATEDEAEAVAVPADDEEPPAPKKKKAKAKVEKEVVAPAGPGCLGRLIGAGIFTVVGVLLLGVLVVALLFVSPELVDDVYHQLPNVAPKQKVVTQPPVAQPTPLESASKAFAAGDYDQVVQTLKEDNDPQAAALRGEATWLKYAKAKADAKQPLNEADKEVQEAIKDLRGAKEDLRAEMIVRTIREPQQQAQLAQLKKAQGGAAELVKKMEEAVTERNQAVAQLQDIGKVLAGAKVIADPDAVSADGVRKLIKDVGDAQAAVAGVTKVLQQAGVKEPGPKGVAVLAAANKQATEQLTDVNKALADAKVKDGGAKGVQEILDARAKVQKDRDELDAATKAAYDELVKAKVVPPGGDPRKALVEGAKLARTKSESPLAGPLTHLGSTLTDMGQGVGNLLNRGADVSVLAAELALLKARQEFMQMPAEKLDTHAMLLQDRNFKDAKRLAAIQRETDWVLSREAKVSPEARAKALYVSGLALRNEEKFDAAHKALEAAVKHPGAKGAPWEKQARAALAELTDPQAYYLPQIERLQTAGNHAAALSETDTALKALPGAGKLLAERGLLRLESQRGKGKLSAEAQQQIRSDAEAAAKTKDGAAAGAYVLGLLEEELGQYAKAETQLRQAIKLAAGNDDAAVRYRIALARVLLRDRPAAAAPAPAAAPPGDDEEASAAMEQRPTAFVHPVTALLLTAVIGQAPDEREPEQENPEAAKRLREAFELAKVLASSKDPKVREQGYTLLGEAAGKAGLQLTSKSCLDLARGLVEESDPKLRGTGLMLYGQGLVKQGHRTEGLQKYTEGLELLNPGTATSEIGRMVREHPAFVVGDAADRPNPLLAEKHFGAGLHLYWAHRYPEAEAQFKQAVSLFNQDSRYLYFLGLAQLAQPGKLKRDHAYNAFNQGARLEAQGRPSIAEINTSLERIQGPVRQLLNAFRTRDTAGTAE